MHTFAGLLDDFGRHIATKINFDHDIVGIEVVVARPSGNVTGLTIVNTDLVAKQMEILKEVVPQATRIGVLFSPTAPSHRPALQAVQTAGQKRGVQIQLIPVRISEDPTSHSQRWPGKMSLVISSWQLRYLFCIVRALQNSH